MRRALLALVFLAALVPSAAFAYASPGAPTGYVNDFANALSAEAKSALETELATFDATTTNQIAVVTVKDLGGDYIENYAVKLFEEWKIGTSENDNGVLILLAIDDRQLRIEVGYGLEGAFPDSIANSIVNEVMVPRLKAGDYDGAVMEGARAVMSATAGEYQASGRTAMPTSWNDLFTLGIFGLVIVQWIAAILARSRSIWAGGVLGLIVGAIASSVLGLWVLTGVITTLVLAALGTLFDFAVSTAYHEASVRGSRPPWWTGGAGGFGGGSSGGFGGFGGGGSGGGGSSGSW